MSHIPRRINWAQYLKLSALCGAQKGCWAPSSHFQARVGNAAQRHQGDFARQQLTSDDGMRDILSKMFGWTSRCASDSLNDQRAKHLF